MLAHAPDDAARLLAEARSGARWRGDLGLPEPSPLLSQAISSLTKTVLAAGTDDAAPSFATMIVAASETREGEAPLDALVRQVLRAMLEERQTRMGAGSTARTREVT